MPPIEIASVLSTGLISRRREFQCIGTRRFSGEFVHTKNRRGNFCHIPLAILAVAAGWSRWLELRLPLENPTRNAMGKLWPVCIVLIGTILLNYHEM
jgi:hypothetical protein